jgi:hypothetical protein
VWRQASNAAIWISAGAWHRSRPGPQFVDLPGGDPAEDEEVCYCSRMALDTDKIDEAVLALLLLTRHDHWRA